MAEDKVFLKSGTIVIDKNTEDLFIVYKNVDNITYLNRNKMVCEEVPVWLTNIVRADVIWKHKKRVDREVFGEGQHELSLIFENER